MQQMRPTKSVRERHAIPTTVKLPSDTTAIQFDDTCFLLYRMDDHGYDWFELSKRDKAKEQKRKNVEFDTMWRVSCFSTLLSNGTGSGLTFPHNHLA